MTNQPKSFVSLSLIRQGFPDSAHLAALARFPLDRDEIRHPEIEDLLRVITRRFDRFPLKGRVLYLYTNNRIRLLGNKETVVVPSFVPAWRVAGERGVMAYVNAVPYVPAAGPGSMDVRRLFGLLLFGQVLVDTMENWGKISASPALGRHGGAVYARMMFKVVDRICGTGSDRMRSDQVKFVFTKYFILNMLGSAANEQANAVAAALTPATSLAGLLAFEATVNAAASGAAPDPDEPKASDLAAGQGAHDIAVDPGRVPDLYSLDLVALLQALARSDAWLSRLTARGFLQSFSAMYNPPAMLAAEDAGFFLGILANHQANSDIVNSYAFDPIFGTEGTDAIVELARLCG